MALTAAQATLLASILADPYASEHWPTNLVGVLPHEVVASTTGPMGDPIPVYADTGPAWALAAPVPQYPVAPGQVLGTDDRARRRALGIYDGPDPNNPNPPVNPATGTYTPVPVAGVLPAAPAVGGAPAAAPGAAAGAAGGSGTALGGSGLADLFARYRTPLLVGAGVLVLMNTGLLGGRR